MQGFLRLLFVLIDYETGHECKHLDFEATFLSVHFVTPSLPHSVPVPLTLNATYTVDTVPSRNSHRSTAVVYSSVANGSS